MTCITVISPTTDASTQDGSFINADALLLFADGLALAEEVDVFVLGGLAAIPYSVGGTVQKLTATAPMLALQPGVAYRFAKDATAAPCGVYVHVAPKN